MDDNNKLTVDDVADFTWGFGARFLLETSKGNYVWYSPAYEGDNTIRPFDGDCSNFAGPDFMGRDKGRHFIKDYCGPDVQILDFCVGQ